MLDRRHCVRDNCFRAPLGAFRIDGRFRRMACLWRGHAPGRGCRPGSRGGSRGAHLSRRTTRELWVRVPRRALGSHTAFVSARWLGCRPRRHGTQLCRGGEQRRWGWCIVSVSSRASQLMCDRESRRACLRQSRPGLQLRGQRVRDRKLRLHARRWRCALVVPVPIDLTPKRTSADVRADVQRRSTERVDVASQGRTRLLGRRVPGTRVALAAESFRSAA